MLIALLLTGIVVIALLVGLSNAIRFNAATDAKETARNYAEYCMQYTKNRPFDTVTPTTSYLPLPSTTPHEYNGYSASIAVTPLGKDNSGNIVEQIVTVTVNPNNNTITPYTLSDIKVNY